jgi:hypothetical protein
MTVLIATSVANFLQREGFGTYGTDIFAGYEPGNPDECVIVRPYGASGGERVQEVPGIAYEMPYLQIEVRGPVAASGTYDAMELKAYQIFQALAPIQNTEWDGAYIRKIAMIQSSPFFLGRDDHQRERFTMNIRIEKGPSV